MICCYLGKGVFFFRPVALTGGKKKKNNTYKYGTLWLVHGLTSGIEKKGCIDIQPIL